jgi:hypothetical protein
MKRLFLLLFFPLVLGCAAAGQMSESDFIWQDKTLNAPYKEIYNRIIKGFQECDWQNFYHVESNLFPEISEVHFFIFSRGHGGGKGPYVIGRIILKGSEGSETKIRAGVFPFWKDSKTGLRSSEWLKMAEGDYSWCK